MKEEPYAVQLQILNAAVKTFLKTQTEESYSILNTVFEFTSKEADNPDLRERGFVYWRLMAIDPNIAAQIILCEKPRISEDVSGYDSSLLDIMVNNIGSLASIYVKPPELFVKKTKAVNLGEEEETDYEENVIRVDENEIEAINENVKKVSKKSNLDENTNNIGKKSGEGSSTKAGTANNTSSSQGNSVINNNLLDINDLLGSGSSNPNTNNNPINNTNNNTINSQKVTSNLDMIGLFADNNEANFNSLSINSKVPAVIPKMTVLSNTQPGYTSKSTGLAIEASLQREGDKLVMNMNFINTSQTPLQNFEIQFNKNYFGLTADTNGLKNLRVNPGTDESRSVNIVITSPDTSKIPSYDPPIQIQTAIRCNLDEFYFTVPIMLCTLFTSQMTRIDFQDFQSLWANTQSPKDLFLTLNNLHAKYQSDSAVFFPNFRSSIVWKGTTST